MKKILIHEERSGISKKQDKLAFFDHSGEKGQSVVEVLLAIAIIVMVMVGFLTQSTSNFLTVAESNDRMIAVNLAREGLEIFRHLRDTNWLRGCPDPQLDCTQWDTGLSAGTDYTFALDFDPSTAYYKLLFAPDTLEDCVSDQSCLLYTHANGVYNHQPVVDDESAFYRLMTALPICADPSDCGGDGICEQGMTCASGHVGYKVTSQVRWFERDQSRNVVMDEDFYNWR